MKVALIGRYRVPFPFSEHRLDYGMLKSMAEALGELHLLVQGREPEEGIWREGALIVHYAPEGAVAGTVPGFLLWALRSLRRIHRERRLDIANGSDLWGGLAALLARPSIGVRVIAQLQGEFLPPSPFAYRWLPRLILHALARIVCRRADRVRCLHPGAFERVASLGVPRAKIALIHTRCDVESFDPARFPPREPGGSRLLFVGNLIRGKGVRYLLVAFAKLAGRNARAELTVVGDGPEGASLKRLASTLGVATRTAFLGRRPHEDLPRLLHQSDLFVFPSLAEAGAPRAVLEAMSMEIPVVATRLGGIAELLEDGRCGRLVPPADPDQLAEAIAMALADPAWAREAGREGRRRVAAGYTVQAHVQGMLALHRSLMESPDA